MTPAPIYDGRVVAWRTDRGYGFLRAPQLPCDVFCHITAIVGGEGRWHLQVGDRVRFLLAADRRGRPCARHVVRLDEADDAPGPVRLTGAGRDRPPKSPEPSAAGTAREATSGPFDFE